VLDHNDRIGDDRVLWTRLQESDESALGVLFDRQYADLVHYAMRQGLLREEARDLVQEIFIDLWDRRATLAVRTTLTAYLYGAVRRAILSARRHDRVVARWRATELAEASSAPRVAHNVGEGQAEADAVSVIVDRTVAAMPPRMREIFELSRTHGLSHPEIAEMLGVSVKTVAEQILRALRLLRDAIGRSA
jgi:RNA polymerase sigma-70 factor (ECF subfamily)